MPSMYEIYEKHSFEYDELVRHEDYQGNLYKTLQSLFDFSGKAVLEFGTGTGRLTAMYASSAEKIFCFDRSSHMLEKARQNLLEFEDKINYDLCDNNQISSLDEKGDFVIEGWSFGHTVSDQSVTYTEKADELISTSLGRLKEEGTCIIIETLGTAVDTPIAPNKPLSEFYRLLEVKHGFTRVEISTDYRFESVEKAADICGFFFGAEAGEEIRKEGSLIVREFTGLWYKNV